MSKTVKYIGRWASNNSYGNNYLFTNKREAIKTMRKICKGNTCIGDTGRWTVDNIEKEEIASGIVRR